jgi:hypothetical protein
VSYGIIFGLLVCIDNGGVGVSTAVAAAARCSAVRDGVVYICISITIESIFFFFLDILCDVLAVYV